MPIAKLLYLTFCSAENILFQHIANFLSFFYRATLCISAVFAVIRCLSVRPSVRPSVCLSVCHVRAFYSRRLKISSNLFVGPVAHHSSFFDPSVGVQFQGEPLQRGRKIEGVGKFCDFRLKSKYIS